MANIPSSSIPPKATSGISKIDNLPQVLPYPTLLPFESTPSIHNIFCYVLRHYGVDGLSVLFYRQPQKDQVVTIFGDWKGNNLDLVGSAETPLTKLALSFAQSDKLALFLKTMQLIRLEQAQFFFGVEDDDLILVDMQVSLNKFTGPGMIRDIFSEIHRTQEVLKTEIIDERAIEYIGKGTGSYEGDIILKPTKFKVFHDPDVNKFQPLYVEVRR
jgi:hypothetical protein